MNGKLCPRRIVQTTLMAMLAVCASASQGATQADAKPSLAGIWFPDPARSERMTKDPPYTREGKAIVEQFRATHHPTKDDPGAFCIPAGMPSIALGGADYPVEILETKDQVTILMELHQQVRRIFLNAKHPDDVFPQRNGHSIGQWRGDVLVVDTVGIRPVPFGAVPHSEQARVTERWQRIDGGQALVNEITLNDPKMYSRPIVLKQFYKAAGPGTRMMEYDCTEALWAEHERSIGL